MKKWNVLSAILGIVLTLNSYKVLCADDENSDWRSLSSSYLKSACIELYGNDEGKNHSVCNEVLLQMEKWDPDSASGKIWSLLMRFRHSYLHSDSVRGIIRGYFLPGLMMTAFKYTMGFEAMVDLEVVNGLVHSSEALIEVLRNVHKIPYGYQGSAADLVTSAATIGQHYAAAHSYDNSGLLFGAVAILTEGGKYQYMEVVLKHLQRLYEKSSDKEQQLTLVNIMLAHI